MNGNPLPPKKEVALALLERASVHVHLDPRADGVVVPAWFKRQPQLVLQVGLNMPVPIPDLRVDEDGMSCTLSFNRSPFFCVVPWSSVYAMVGEDGRGMVWPEDVPPEVGMQARSREAGPSVKPPVAARALAVVKSPGEPVRKGSPKPAARPRATRGEAAADAVKAKRPRSRKARADVGPTVVDKPSAAPRLAGDGVLVPIPATAKSRRQVAEPPPTPPGTSTDPSDRGSPDLSTAGKASAPRAHPAARSVGPSTKPVGGKTKREIPPYLRVVK